MKKILIVNNNLHIGGVQKALISLLWEIHEYYDITLALFYKGGAYLEELPEDVKAVQIKSLYRFLGMTKYDRKGNLYDRVGRSFFAFLTRIIGRKAAVGLMALSQKDIGGYDIAISYLHNSGEYAFYGGCNEFVLKHVQAEKKIAFLHCDYSLCGADTRRNQKQYSQFDWIAVCSKGCGASFLCKNPLLQEKVKVVYNCHQFEKIKAEAGVSKIEMSSKYFNIVTVARLGKEKGVGRAIKAIANLKNSNQRIRYYVIGDGIERTQIQALIEEAGLLQVVILCGELVNPYGYMQAADLLLIPSYSEAAPMVIGEAACLGTPILTTRTSSAEELIEETNFGWVCENSEKGIEESLEWVLQNVSEVKNKKRYLADYQCSNEQALSQFFDVVEG